MDGWMKGWTDGRIDRYVGGWTSDCGEKRASLGDSRHLPAMFRSLGLEIVQTPPPRCNEKRDTGNRIEEGERTVGVLVRCGEEINSGVRKKSRGFGGSDVAVVRVTTNGFAKGLPRGRVRQSLGDGEVAEPESQRRLDRA